MTCQVCQRASRGFYYREQIFGGKTYAFCSMDHVRIFREKYKMIDPTKNELISCEAAGRAGGEYLVSLNKYNFADLTTEEYENFVRVIIHNYTEELAKLFETMYPKDIEIG